MLHALANHDASTLLKCTPERDVDLDSSENTEITIVAEGEDSMIIAEKGTSVRVSYSICSREGDTEVAIESSDSFTFDVDGGGVFLPLNRGVKGLTKGTRLQAE